MKLHHGARTQQDTREYLKSTALWLKMPKTIIHDWLDSWRVLQKVYQKLKSKLDSRPDLLFLVSIFFFFFATYKETQTFKQRFFFFFFAERTFFFFGAIEEGDYSLEEKFFPLLLEASEKKTECVCTTGNNARPSFAWLLVHSPWSSIPWRNAKRTSGRPISLSAVKEKWKYIRKRRQKKCTTVAMISNHLLTVCWKRKWEEEDHAAPHNHDRSGLVEMEVYISLFCLFCSFFFLSRLFHRWLVSYWCHIFTRIHLAFRLRKYFTTLATSTRKQKCLNRTLHKQVWFFFFISRFKDFIWHEKKREAYWRVAKPNR